MNHALSKPVRLVDWFIHTYKVHGSTLQYFVRCGLRQHGCHCVGSLALSCGLLDGTIPAEHIKGITTSNVFMTPILAKVNKKASQLVPLNRVYGAVVGPWFSCVSSKQDGLIQQAINQLLRFSPVGERREICNSVAYHRSSLVFGRWAVLFSWFTLKWLRHMLTYPRSLWSHRNLNAATHSQLSHFMGGTSMSSLAHLMMIGRSGHVMTSHPNSINLVTPFNTSRLRGIPILFFSGSENTVFDQQSTDISCTMLRDAFGVEWVWKTGVWRKSSFGLGRIFDLFEFFCLLTPETCLAPFIYSKDTNKTDCFIHKRFQEKNANSPII